MEPLIITVAAVGAELSPEEQPNLPITPDELARDAAACREAGACIYHLHVRDSAGTPTMDVDVFRTARDAIVEATDLIVQFTTGGAVSDAPEDRIAPLELQPEMASLTTGTVNFGDEVFFNPLPLVREFHQRMVDMGVVPEFEIFEPGMIATAERVYEEHGSSHHKHFDFVLGVPGAMPAWPDAVEWLSSKLSDGATWSATGIGRHNFPVAATSVAVGGHVRTGFEDVRYIEPGKLVRSNRELVERVVAIGRDGGREIATPAQAREVLGL
ncbi:MAG TPA: 3-keto-5-aminohexanoate cleavage protein [Actinomycetota bacterium]|nr:3-keto-5-aminohexanoate cleavage protein [Actinomycetota bacterium]